MTGRRLSILILSVSILILSACDKSDVMMKKLNSAAFTESSGKSAMAKESKQGTATGAPIPLRYLCSTGMTKAAQTNVLTSANVKVYVFQNNRFISSSGTKDEVINKKQISLPGSLPDGDYSIKFCDSRFEATCTQTDIPQGIGVMGPIKVGANITLKGGKVSASIPLSLPLTPSILYAENPDVRRFDSDGDDRQPNPECDEKMSPLIIDTDDQGIELSAPLYGVQFDINGDGKKDNISWPIRASNMFLVLDRNHDGQINDIHEMFGNYTVGPDGHTSKDGFDALAKYDSNRDEKISDRDNVYRSLQLWSDQNFNAKVDKGELKTLAELGIKEILIPRTPYNVFELDQYHNETRRRSLVRKDNGALLKIVDIWFRVIPDSAFKK